MIAVKGCCHSYGCSVADAKRRGRLPVWREEPACSIAMPRQPCTLQATLCIHFFCTMRMVHQTVLMM